TVAANSVARAIPTRNLVERFMLGSHPFNKMCEFYRSGRLSTRGCIGNRSTVEKSDECDECDELDFRICDECDELCRILFKYIDVMDGGMHKTISTSRVAGVVK